MKRKVIVSLLIIILITIAAGIIFNLLISKPAYKPGVLRARSDLEKFTTPPTQSDVESGYWRVDGETKIYYFSDGEGEPVLVIHGGPGFPPSKPWKGLRKVEGYKFYYYHQRGCGKSTRPFDQFKSKNYYKNMMTLIGKLGMEQQLADIERIRKILNVEQLILIGHSYGGFIATLYAIEFPEHVKKMILISPAGVLKLPPDNDGMTMVRKYLSEDRKDDFDEFLKEYFDYGKIFIKSEEELASLNLEYGQFFIEAAEKKGIDIPHHIKQQIAQRDQIGGWMVHAMFLSLGRKYDYRKELGKIRTNSLIIYGEKDVYPASISEEYAKLIPNSKKKMVPEAGHFPYDEKSEYFTRVVRGFLPEK